MEDPVVPLDRSLYGHLLAGLLWERQCETVQLEHGWEKVPNWECLLVNRRKGLFLSVLWMTSNWLERNKTLIRCGKYWIKKLILENQHHFLTMFIWDALNVNVKGTRTLWTKKEKFWNDEFLLQQLKSYSTQKLSRDLTIWRDMLKNALKDVVSWRCTKSQLLAWMTITSRRRSWNRSENCQKHAHILSKKACILHELADVTFFCL